MSSSQNKKMMRSSSRDIFFKKNDAGGDDRDMFLGYIFGASDNCIVEAWRANVSTSANDCIIWLLWL